MRLQRNKIKSYCPFEPFFLNAFIIERLYRATGGEGKKSWIGECSVQKIN